MRVFNKLAYLSIDPNEKLSNVAFNRWGYFLISKALCELLTEKKIELLTNSINIIDKSGLNIEISKYAARIPHNYSKRRQTALLIYSIIERYNHDVDFRRIINSHMVEINISNKVSTNKDKSFIQKIKNTINGSCPVEIRSANNLIVSHLK
jgi:hypothetical protein